MINDNGVGWFGGYNNFKFYYSRIPNECLVL